MFESPYLELTLRVAAFACWSSFWPRNAIKRRLEPVVGYRAYRIFYNLGTMGLLAWTYAYLVYRSPETTKLWDLHGYAWFKPLVYAIETVALLFLTSLIQFGLSFWGLRNPPAGKALHTGGFFKITRHPLYWSVFFLFFGHTLAMGTLLSVQFFILMELYNVIAVIALENRALAREFGPAFKEFQKNTSTLPFKSLLSGRAKLSSEELPWRWVVGALVFTLAIASLHDRLILGTISFVRPLFSREIGG